MASFFQTLTRIERRMRLVRGTHIGALSFFATTLIIASVMVAGYLGIISLDSGEICMLAPIPFLVLLVAWFIGRRLPVNVPRALLQVDLSLAIGERFSSLYELYRQAQVGPYRDLIEQKLRALNPDWKRGMPFHRSILLVPMAVCVLAAGVGLIMASPSDRAMRVASSATVVSSESETRRISASDNKPVAIGTDARPSSPAAVTPGTPQHNLEDVLADLWNSSSSPGVLSGDQQDLDQLISSQRAAAQALEELISQIERRLSEEGKSELTPEERQALSELAERMGNTPVGQALRGLAQTETPNDLAEQLEAMRQLARSLDNPSEGMPDEMADNGLPPPEQDGEGQGITWSPPASSPGEEADGDTKPHESEAAQPSDGESPSSERAAAQADDDSYGGNQGTGDGSVGSTAALPQFVRQELAGIIGPSGDFQDFATKGVPLEQLPGQTGDGPVPAVDYAALRALLDGRTLPPGAADVVRAYFDNITQGGK